MSWYLSIEEQRKLLARYVERASGRTQDLLLVCLNAFPHPISHAQLMAELGIDNQKTFISLLRNANLVIEISRTGCGTHNYYYLLGGYEFKQSLISRWIGNKMGAGQE
ncbi:hypothetical protein V9N52_002631 [Vibrio navarrensis]